MHINLFPIARPESMGISSKQILKFLEKAEDNGIMLHSVLMMRKGHVVAEGYYAPFTKDSLHRIYSVSKTFVSTAIGLLADEGVYLWMTRCAVILETSCLITLIPGYWI